MRITPVFLACARKDADPEASACGAHAQHAPRLFETLSAKTSQEVASGGHAEMALEQSGQILWTTFASECALT
jgi:hypothetical protein